MNVIHSFFGSFELTVVIVEAFAVELKETSLDSVHAPAIKIALLEGAHLFAVQKVSLAVSLARLIAGQRSIGQFEGQVESVEVRR